MKHQKTRSASKKSLISKKKFVKKIQKVRQNQILRTLNEVPKLKFSMFRASKQQKTRSPPIKSIRS
jgi:hypothetical protein